MTQQVVPFCRIWIDGELYAHEDALLELEVDERSDEASSFRMVLRLSPAVRGWDLLGDERLGLLRQITIALGIRLRGNDEVVDEAIVMQGYVTALKPRFGEGRIPDSSLELSGLDASWLMHIEERTKQWSGQTDGQIVRALFSQYGFSANVSEVSLARPEKRGSLMQRCTDAEFLRMLARRNGFEAYVEHNSAPITKGAVPGPEIVGHFHPPSLDAKAQPGLELMPRESPSIIEMSARWDCHRPTALLASHMDERSRRVLTARANAERIPRPGTAAQNLEDILKSRLQAILPNMPDIQATGLQSAFTPWDAAELQSLALSGFRDADWFVKADALVDGTRYPAILRARRPITLTGAGEKLDGTWYVRRACHRFMRLMPDGTKIKTYEVQTELVRNTLGVEA